MWQYFMQVFEAELSRLWNYKRDFVVLLGAPILYLVMFGFLYMDNAVNHINTVVWDQDQSSLSRTVITNFGNSDRFNIIDSVSSEDELKAYLDQGKAKIGIVIPKDFIKDIKKGHTSQVLLCVDGTNLVIANASLTSALEVVQTLSAGVGIKTLEGGGTLPDKAMKTIAPISFRTRIWYNPTLGYSDFFLLGLLGTVIQQILLLFVSVTIARDKDLGTLPGTSFREVSAYVMGKSAPYMIINYLNLNFVLGILLFGFGIKFQGSLLLGLLLELFFIVALVSLGVFLSIVCKNELEATQISMLIAVPSFLVSGFTWPYQSMPAGIKAIASMLPLTYYVNSLRDLALKGIGFTELLPSFLFLLGLTFLLFPLSILALRMQIVKLNKTSDRNHSYAV